MCGQGRQKNMPVGDTEMSWKERREEEGTKGEKREIFCAFDEVNAH